MKQKKVFLLSGPPASGKSSWVRERMTSNDEWISRDNVRFSIVREDEEYFSHEDEVFDTFINYINQTLEKPEVEYVFIDATHINYKSRHNTLSKVRMKNVEELNCVCFTTPLAVCLERNRLREGRARVPDEVISSMYKNFSYPSKRYSWAPKFDEIWEVNAEGILVNERR